jgi:hypothetical protein
MAGWAESTPEVEVEVLDDDGEWREELGLQAAAARRRVVVSRGLSTGRRCMRLLLVNYPERVRLPAD